MKSFRKLSAILAVDVVGYSRMMGEDEAGTLKAVRETREAVRPLVRAKDGRIVKTIGDGLLLEFPSVVAATECAIGLQRILAERNASTPSHRRIVYRIGVHLGDVLVEENDIFGDGVNVAARLEAICEPGGLCLSEDAHRHVAGRIDAVFEDLGEKTLKNIARPVRVFGLSAAAIGAVRTPDPAPTPPRLAEPRSTPPLSIVVLPFSNLGGGQEQDYFVDGVVESLTTDLSRIPGAFVIARNTAFTFKSKAVDVKRVGRELGVRYALEGSVQRGANRIRVNVQLIDALSGAHLWAERFEKPVADLFDLQDEIVARLANQLNVQLFRAEGERSAAALDPDATDLVMRAWALLRTRTQGEACREAALDCFESALALQPDHDLALVGSAIAYAHERLFGPVNPTRDYKAKILDRANRAIAIRPNNTLAYCAKGLYSNFAENNVTEALRNFDAGLDINPNDAMSLACRGSAKNYLRQFDGAKADVMAALTLSPHDPWAPAWHNYLADAELGLDQVESALAEARRAVEGGYRVWLSHLNVAICSVLLGLSEAAGAALAEARRLNPDLSIAHLAKRKPILTPRLDALRAIGLPEN